MPVPPVAVDVVRVRFCCYFEYFFSHSYRVPGIICYSDHVRRHLVDEEEGPGDAAGERVP